MRISRNYTVDQWSAIPFTSEDDWQVAVTMFEDRVKSRYFEHIEPLLPRETSGFAVLTIDCALLEALEQFYRGERSTPQGKVKSYFISALAREPFSKHFDETMAGLFYSTIRNGLLHQAEAESNSRVKSSNDLPVVSYTPNQKGVVINKIKFHRLLESAFAAYAVTLRAGGDDALRAAFRKKMDQIARVESKPGGILDDA